MGVGFVVVVVVVVGGSSRGFHSVPGRLGFQSSEHRITDIQKLRLNWR